MELAQALQLLWRRKIMVALGVVVAIGVGFAAVHLLKKEGYATASTQMIVDSPRSPLGNAGASLVPFTARASVFADLMASHPAVAAIAEAAHIQPTEIVATGPSNVGGTTSVSPAPPNAPQPVAPKYKLFIDQDPTLPTVDIYAQAPTTEQAVALADAAVTGFAGYLRTLEDQTSINAGQRIQVRQLGTAVGGAVDPSASKKIAALIGLAVLLLWCANILLVERLRGNAPQHRGSAATAADGDPFEDGLTFELVGDEWSPEATAGLQTDPLRNGAARRARVERRDLDEQMPEITDRVGALAQPSSAPDER
jgi:hypothetical protein